MEPNRAVVIGQRGHRPRSCALTIDPVQKILFSTTSYPNRRNQHVDMRNRPFFFIYLFILLFLFLLSWFGVLGGDDEDDILLVPWSWSVYFIFLFWDDRQKNPVGKILLLTRNRERERDKTCVLRADSDPIVCWPNNWVEGGDVETFLHDQTIPISIHFLPQKSCYFGRLVYRYRKKILGTSSSEFF